VADVPTEDELGVAEFGELNPSVVSLLGDAWTAVRGLLDDRFGSTG
jgi:hypothetical protein